MKMSHPISERLKGHQVEGRPRKKKKSSHNKDVSNANSANRGHRAKGKPNRLIYEPLSGGALGTLGTTLEANPGRG